MQQTLKASVGVVHVQVPQGIQLAWLFPIPAHFKLEQITNTPLLICLPNLPIATG